MFSTHLAERLPPPDDYHAPLHLRQWQEPENNLQQQDGVEEEEEETVHALDLRICKAAESITIFDEANVLTRAQEAGPARMRRKHIPERYCPYGPTNGSASMKTESQYEVDARLVDEVPLNRSDCDTRQQIHGRGHMQSWPKLFPQEQAPLAWDKRMATNADHERLDPSYYSHVPRPGLNPVEMHQSHDRFYRQEMLARSPDSARWPPDFMHERQQLGSRRPPPPLAPLSNEMNSNQDPMFGHTFHRHPNGMRPSNYFLSHRDRSQQLLLAAAARQQEQYKLSTEALRKRLLSMHHAQNGYQDYPEHCRALAPAPPLLLQQENGFPIKKELNHHLRPDKSVPTWPEGCERQRIKEEKPDIDEMKEKFNPDKLRSTFLWHVLQRHSSKTLSSNSTPQDDDISEVDDRLKSIENASGLHNNEKGHNIEEKRPQYTREKCPSPVTYKPPRMAVDLEQKCHLQVPEDKLTEKLLSPSYSNDLASPYSISVASPDDDLSLSGKRGRPRKHAPKIPLPPIYVFIRNLLHNKYYNPRVVSWVNEAYGIFRVNNTTEFARTWGLMKSNRGVKMNYEKLSRAMRYHYGSAKQGRKGHLAMVKEKRLFYRFGELAINWRKEEVVVKRCDRHDLCKQSLCLWTKE